MPINCERFLILDEKALDKFLIEKGLIRNSTKWHKVWHKNRHKFLYVADSRF